MNQHTPAMVDPDHSYGRPAVCPHCLTPVHRARWVGLDLDLDAQTLPVTVDLTAPGAARGVMQWTPEAHEWVGIFAGRRTWRETRAMHSLTCPDPRGRKHERKQETP